MLLQTLFRGKVYEYASKIQAARNSERLVKKVEIELSEDEKMEVMFRQWKWAVFRGSKHWQDKLPKHWERRCQK